MFEVYGHYTLLEKLAMGGMAEVFLAKKMATGVEKFVAIKRILPQYSQTPEFIDMFKREASIAINLSHSNIVSIFDFGLEKSQFYLVMDFVSGRNLRQMLNHIRRSNVSLPPEHAIFIIKEIAAGLDYAHRAMDNKTGKPLNIIHRDISPQNIMISFEGEVRIVDFGIAKTEAQTENTQAGTLKGKFGYMSPEQVDGMALDLRTDIFSLGIVLWELLANDRLFIANNEHATLRKIRECKVPPLRQLNPSIPSELERIVAKALARDRNTRYQACAALQKDLNVFLNKHYPMFTTQDFSGFIKKQFNSEILENRRKQMEYSAIKGGRSKEENEPTSTDALSASQTQAESGRPSQQQEDHDDTIITETGSKNVLLGDSHSSSGHKTPKPTSELAANLAATQVSPRTAPAEAPKPAKGPEVKPANAKAPETQKQQPSKPPPPKMELDIKTPVPAPVAAATALTPAAPSSPAPPPIPQERNLSESPAVRKIDASDEKPARLEIDHGSYNTGFFTTSGGTYNSASTSSRLVNRQQQQRHNWQKYVAVFFSVTAVSFLAYTIKQNSTVKKLVVNLNQCISRPMDCGTDKENLPSAIPQAKANYKIYVNSNPSNAEILVDGVRPTSGSKTTPDFVEVPEGRTVKIQIRMDGFNIWEKTISVEDGNQTITADLSRAKSASLIVNVQGRGDVFINKKNVGRCDSKNPCLVEPDKRLLIEAYDVATNAYDKNTLTLSDGENKKITLIPTVKEHLLPDDPPPKKHK